MTSVAGHRVTALSRDRSGLSLSLEMRGLIVPLVGRMSKGMIDRYMTTEANGIRRIAEHPSGGRADDRLTRQVHVHSTRTSALLAKAVIWAATSEPPLQQRTTAEARMCVERFARTSA